MATPRRYLIIGGGMTADAAAHSLREADVTGEITVLSAEHHLPYARPPLTKALWKGEPLDSVWRGTQETGARVLLGRLAVSIDRANQRVKDDRGETHPYDALLIATGSAPVRLPFGGDDIVYFRGLDDYLRMRALAAKGKRFAVIGGGFIGSELAASLRQNDKDVVMLFPDAGLCARVFPADLSASITEFYREKGVDVRTGAKVTDVVREGARLAVVTADGTRHVVDGVVGGIGVRPGVTLAQEAGLTVDDGILVDEQLRTSDPNIFAAGDVARFKAPAVARSLRVEHEDAALTMGKTAGLAMVGRGARYDHLPFFYSDLFEVGYEAVGVIDSQLTTSAVWKQPFREGVVYYLEGGQIRGMLLVNTWGQVDAARAIVQSGQVFDPAKPPL